MYPFPSRLREIFGCGERGFVKGLSVIVDHKGVRVPYAEIVEIYSPEVLFPSEFEYEGGSTQKIRARLDKEFA